MKRNNLLGRKFGRLTVIAEAEPRIYESGRKIRWKCLCECGNYVIVDGSNLCTGHTRSCGCLLIESSSRIGSDKEIRKKINATKASKPKVKRSYRQSYTVALENGTLVDDSYSVYKHTNLINGKVYVGITRRNPKDRWGKNGYNYKTSGNIHFSSAIEKYGWDNFSHEILLSGLSKKEAEDKEVELIALYQATNPNVGYNIQNGGNTHGRMTDEIKEKIAAAHRGKKHSEEAKMKMREAALKTSRERAERLSQRMTGGKPWNTGMIFNEEERDKIKGSTYKPVRCVETDTIFKSVSFAGRQLALSQSNISRSCKTGCVCGGFHWEYV